MTTSENQLNVFYGDSRTASRLRSVASVAYGRPIVMSHSKLERKFTPVETLWNHSDDVCRAEGFEWWNAQDEFNMRMSEPPGMWDQCRTEIITAIMKDESLYGHDSSRESSCDDHDDHDDRIRALMIEQEELKAAMRKVGNYVDGAEWGGNVAAESGNGTHKKFEPDDQAVIAKIVKFRTWLREQGAQTSAAGAARTVEAAPVPVPAPAPAPETAKIFEGDEEAVREAVSEALKEAGNAVDKEKEVEKEAGKEKQAEKVKPKKKSKKKSKKKAK